MPKKGNPELFNIATDPYETTNLAGKEADKIGELQKLHAEFRAGDNDVLPKDLEGLPH